MCRREKKQQIEHCAFAKYLRQWTYLSTRGRTFVGLLRGASIASQSRGVARCIESTGLVCQLSLLHLLLTVLARDSGTVLKSRRGVEIWIERIILMSTSGECVRVIHLISVTHRWRIITVQWKWLRRSWPIRCHWPTWCVTTVRLMIVRVEHIWITIV